MMKKFNVLFIVLFVITHFHTHAQIFRDNIAVVVNSTCFNCNLNEELQETMRSANYAFFTTELEKNELFRVVNRDVTDESILGLGKTFNHEDPGFSYWVNYTEKLKEQSKGIGANYLILIDVFNFIDKKTLKGEIYFRFKIIQTETNGLVTFTIKRDEIFKSEEQYRTSVKEMLNSVSYEMMEKIDEVWNTAFGIVNAKGKKLTIQPFTVFPLSKSQKINWFEWEEHIVGGKSYFEVRNLGDSKITGLKEGSIYVTTQIDFSNHDLRKVWGNIKPNYGLSNYSAFPVSVVELPIDQSNDGIINFKINSMIYNALESLPKYNLIQISSKELVYAEKEIQKGEEYIDGETVKQYDSRKSDYIIMLNNMGSSADKYKVNIDFISTSTGEILKSKVIESDPTSFSSEVSNWLYTHIMPPCRVELNGKEVYVYTNVRTSIRNNFNYQLIEMKEVKLGNSTEIVRIPLATLKFKEQLGQKIIFEVKEILENDFKKVKNSNDYYLMAY